MLNITDEIMDADLMDSLDADWDLLTDEDVDTTVYDWHADIPSVIQQAAQNLCTEYRGLILTSIAHITDSTTYIAWYEDTTLDAEDDGRVLFREFRLQDGVAIDTYK